MENFITKDNSQKIHSNYEYTSLAKRYCQSRYYLRKTPTDIDADILDPDTPQSVLFTKAAAKKKPIFEIKIQFIVDKTQLPNKQQIMENTTLDHVVFDKDISKEYHSSFASSPGEYKDKTPYTFTVTKQIEIIIE